VWRDDDAPPSSDPRRPPGARCAGGAFVSLPKAPDSVAGRSVHDSVGGHTLMVFRGAEEGATAVVGVRRAEVLVARDAMFASRLASLVPVHSLMCAAQVCPGNHETTLGQFRHFLSVSPVVVWSLRGCSQGCHGLPVHFLACSAHVCPSNHVTFTGQYLHCFCPSPPLVVAEV